MVEEYEVRLMELVKYVSYMDTDQCQADRFIYGLNPNFRELVQMWKPSSVVEGIQHAHYVEEHLDLKGGNITIFPKPLRFVGKATRTFSRGGSLRPPPFGNRVVHRTSIIGIRMVVNASPPAASRNHTTRGHTH